MKELITKYEELRNQMTDVCNAAIDYLSGVVKERGVINFDDFGLDTCEYPCVTYDGGNHPEYNAYPYATVYGASFKDGEVCLDLGEEYTDEYALYRVPWYEVFDIAEFIYRVLNDDYKFSI